MSSIQDLDQRFPIVGDDGRPTDYFMRLIKDRGSAQVSTDATVADLQDSIAGKADKTITLSAGTGLSGGGDLSANRSFDLDAVLDLLNDVDTSSTPPTDGQALVWNNASSLWIPGTVSGGGGGSGIGGGAWKLVEDFTVSGTITAHTVDVTAYDEVICFLVGVNCGTASRRGIRVSTDGGATYDSTAGNYYKYAASGTGDTTTYTQFSCTNNATGALGGCVRITNLRDSTAPKPAFTSDTGDGGARLYVGSNSPITNVQYQSNGNNITAGRMITFGRKTGSQPWWYAPPTAASMSLVSGDATNLTLTDDSDAGLLFDGGAPVTGDKCRVAYRTLTTPANDWVMTAKLNYLLSSNTFSYVGLIMRDSTGGKCVSWKYDNNRTLANSRHTNLGSFSAAGTSITILDYVYWFRITKSGSNVTFSLSASGKQWVDLVTESVTAFMGAAPNQVGFFVGYNKSTQPAIKGACEYFSLTGTAV